MQFLLLSLNAFQEIVSLPAAKSVKGSGQGKPATANNRFGGQVKPVGAPAPKPVASKILDKKPKQSNNDKKSAALTQGSGMSSGEIGGIVGGTIGGGLAIMTAIEVAALGK